LPEDMKKICGRPVVLKVGEIAPLASILLGKGTNKTKGAIGGKTTQRGPKRSPTTDNRSLS